MNVAPAISVGYSPTTFMTARPAETSELGAEARNPSAQNEETTASGLKARYPRVALSFNQDASRLVMLFRDPASGEAVAQIPSKVVVKQYQEAQLDKRREEQSKFQVIVGGADDKAAADANGGNAGQTVSGSAGQGVGAHVGGSGVGLSSSFHVASVSGASGASVVGAATGSSTVSASKTVDAVSGGGAGGGKSSVNVVI